MRYKQVYPQKLPLGEGWGEGTDAHLGTTLASRPVLAVLSGHHTSNILS